MNSRRLLYFIAGALLLGAAVYIAFRSGGRRPPGAQPEGEGAERAAAPPGRGRGGEGGAGLGPAAGPGPARPGRLPEGEAAAANPAYLAGGGSIAGRVAARDTGKPVSGARVLLALDLPGGSEERYAWLAEAAADAEGSFRFGDLRLAAFRLRASAPGRLDAEAAGVLPGSDLEIRLDVDPGIPGRLRLDRDGEPAPLPHRRIILEAAAFGFRLETESGEDGGFRISGLGRERFEAARMADGIEVLVPGYTEAALAAEREGEEEIAVITVEPGLRVAGRVLDRDTAAPIPGAVVAADPENRTITDGAGRYAISGAGDSLTAWAAGRAFETRDLESPEANGEPLEVDFHLTSGIAVAGRVLSSRGAPVAGARISLSSDDLEFELEDERLLRPLRSVLGAVSDRSGRYRIAGIPSEVADLGSLSLEVRPPGWGSGRAEDVEVPAGAGEVAHDIVLDLDGAVAGRVLSAAGAPIEGARIFLESVEDDLHQAAAAGAGGRFEFLNVPPGPYHLSVLDGDFPALHRVIDAPADPLELQLQPGAAVAGRAVSARSGEPLPGLIARLILYEGILDIALHSETDGGGGFRFDGAPTGELILELRPPGSLHPFSPLAPSHREPIDVSDPGWTGEVRYPAYPSAPVLLRFEAADAAGRVWVPPQPVAVEVVSFDPPRGGAGRFPAGRAPVAIGRAIGTFQTRLRAGDYIIKCNYSSGTRNFAASAALEVRDGRPVEQAVVFGP